MDPFKSNYRHLIEAFGFSRVYNLSKKVSWTTLALLESVLAQEHVRLIKREFDLQEFANELFGDVS